MAILKDLLVNGISRFTDIVYGEKGFKGDLNGTAAKATSDANGNNIADTYATKSELQNNYLPLTGGTMTADDGAEQMSIDAWGIVGNGNQTISKFNSISADDFIGLATRATSDENDNVIKDTYATKVEVSNNYLSLTGGTLTADDGAEQMSIDGWGLTGNGNQTIDGFNSITADDFIGLATRATSDEDGNNIKNTYPTFQYTHNNFLSLSGGQMSALDKSMVIAPATGIIGDGSQSLQKFNTVSASNIIGTLHGTADKAIEDEDGNNIKNTYPTFQYSYDNFISKLGSATYNNIFRLPGRDEETDPSMGIDALGIKGNYNQEITGISRIEATNFDGLASKATADEDGNNIKKTYATKTLLNNYLPFSGGNFSDSDGETMYIDAWGLVGNGNQEITNFHSIQATDFVGLATKAVADEDDNVIKDTYATKEEVSNNYLPLDGGTVTGETTFENNVHIGSAAISYNEDEKCLNFNF